LAVSVARVIWHDSLAKIADTKIIGIGIEWFVWYYLSSVLWTCAIFSISRGDCFCLRYMLSDESWRIALYTQKAMEMDFCESVIGSPMLWLPACGRARQCINGLLTEREVCTVKYPTEVF
jgi:hypothetical protein